VAWAAVRFEAVSKENGENDEKDRGRLWYRISDALNIEQAARSLLNNNKLYMQTIRCISLCPLTFNLEYALIVKLQLRIVELHAFRKFYLNVSDDSTIHNSFMSF
jgi:hypothetical protein